MVKRTIYVLMEDGDGTMRSQPTPTGRSVNTEKEAKDWCMEASWRGERDYSAIDVDEPD